MYDGLDLIAELDASDSPVAKFKHGPGVDDPLVMRYGGADYFYHKNHLGSIMEMTDINQSTAKTYDYDAFGNILGESGSLSHNAFTYTGRELHSRSGLYYYRARFYNPELGRFISQDPAGVLGGANLYGYVGNEPIRRIDPSGLLFELIWNDPNERAKHMDQAITMNEFLTYIHGKSLHEVQTEMNGNEWHIAASGGGPRDTYRFVINPNNPNEVLDMRHFLVVGQQGEFFGLGVEILQWGTESSFDAQDFLSNSLGEDFFKTYDYQWPQPPLDMALFQFFSKENRICPEKH